MKAIVVSQFGSPDVLAEVEVSQPQPGPGQVLVKVHAAGVGPWDAWIREGHSAVKQTLPLTLGSDVAGLIESVGPGVNGFSTGDEVYGVTSPSFTGGYAEYAVTPAAMLALKPRQLTFVEAASVPVIAVTAWQMLHDYVQVHSGQTVLIMGGAGNVGAYAVQLAREAGVHVVATASARDADFVRSLGAEMVIAYEKDRIKGSLHGVDAILDLVGGEARESALPALKAGGILVSAVSPLPDALAQQYGIRATFFLVEVTSERLNTLSTLFAAGRLKTHVGSVLPLKCARAAHEMLAGAKHKPGKIVLEVVAVHSRAAAR